MKSLERRFNNIIKKNPYLGPIICITEAIKEQNFSRQTIHYWFNRLIEKDAYSTLDKKTLLKQLLEASNNIQGDQFLA